MKAILIQKGFSRSFSSEKVHIIDNPGLVHVIFDLTCYTDLRHGFQKKVYYQT